MPKNPDKKFSWCPVCMIHTYHAKENGEWVCINPDHEALLRHRTDPWIKEYRQAKADQAISLSVPSEV